MNKIVAIAIIHNTWLQKMGLYETAYAFNEFGLLVSFHNGYNKVK